MPAGRPHFAALRREIQPRDFSNGRLLYNVLLIKGSMDDYGMCYIPLLFILLLLYVWDQVHT